MNRKLILSFIVVCFFASLSFAGTPLSTAQTSSVYVSQTTANSAYGDTMGVNQNAQTFTAPSTFQATEIRLLLYRSEVASGTVTVKLTNTNNGLPAASTLAESAVSVQAVTTNFDGEYVSFTLLTPVTLQDGELYGVTLQFQGEGYVRFRIAVQNLYEGGNFCYSTDNGASWNTRPYDGTFIILGQAVPPPTQTPNPTATQQPTAYPTIPPSIDPTPTVLPTFPPEPTPDGNSILAIFDPKNIGLFVIAGGVIFLCVVFGGKKKHAP